MYQYKLNVFVHFFSIYYLFTKVIMTSSPIQCLPNSYPPEFFEDYSEEDLKKLFVTCTVLDKLYEDYKFIVIDPVTKNYNNISYPISKEDLVLLKKSFKLKGFSEYVNDFMDTYKCENYYDKSENSLFRLQNHFKDYLIKKLKKQIKKLMNFKKAGSIATIGSEEKIDSGKPGIFTKRTIKITPSTHKLKNVIQTIDKERKGNNKLDAQIKRSKPPPNKIVGSSISKIANK